MLYRARSLCSSSIEFLLSRNCIEHEWILFFIEFDLFSSSIRGLVWRSKEALAKGLIPSELRIRLTFTELHLVNVQEKSKKVGNSGICLPFLNQVTSRKGFATFFIHIRPFYQVVSNCFSHRIPGQLD